MMTNTWSFLYLVDQVIEAWWKDDQQRQTASYTVVKTEEDFKKSLDIALWHSYMSNGNRANDRILMAGPSIMSYMQMSPEIVPNFIENSYKGVPLVTINTRQAEDALLLIGPAEITMYIEDSKLKLKDLSCFYVLNLVFLQYK